MNFVEQHINLQSEDLILNSLRGLYWEKHDALIISDLHIGKSGHFRKHGIQITSNVQTSDLKRLSFLISHYRIRQLLVVGDLFHAEMNLDMHEFNQWRLAHADVEIILIKGNHDRLNPEIYQNFNITCRNKDLLIDPFRFVHEPYSETDVFSISGHLHPGISIQLKGQPRIKLPCFQVSKSYLILPAFSLFTGLNVSESDSETKYYAFTESSFFEF
ncbi:ligase-associated DNA damage response endonuclease PdeM [Psychroserpens algicola]|uniref:Ligase-associated DNA damage response endonuclease PdeM n=1 Tax=Psychroserpens algicola TaxID=1719034 RepID=A0ABT0H631_9FLAO|nr:ligase-associated DNA damage response endonuclease PdeM [Psychroserpens algicola]MCK8479837.1 ligase-associated DNA damage response endonuclease PdeM [Psychroserpens algicola]